MDIRPLASSPAVRCVVATVIGTVAIAAVLGAGLYTYVAMSGRSVLNDTLSAQRDGTPMRADVVFETSHLSEHLRAQRGLAALLKDGFAIGRSTFLWEAPQHLGASYSIDVKQDLGLVCEVYRGKAWRISCGQLRCASDDPCRFESAYGSRPPTSGARSVGRPVALGGTSLPNQ